MGRTRVTRSGELLTRVPSRTEQRKIEHRKHVPNPNKLLKPPQKGGSKAFDGDSVPKPVINGPLNDRRKLVLKEATSKGLLAGLPPAFQTLLGTPIFFGRLPLEDVARAEQLDTIEFLMNKAQSLARCEALRVQVLDLVHSGGKPAALIRAKLPPGISIGIETPRMLRATSCDERSNYFQDILKEFAPKI